MDDVFVLYVLYDVDHLQQKVTNLGLWQNFALLEYVG